jgi:hypothetical protein
MDKHATGANTLSPRFDLALPCECKERDEAVLTHPHKVSKRGLHLCFVAQVWSSVMEHPGSCANSVDLVRERTIPTERPPLVGEVSAKFCGYRGVSHGQCGGSPTVVISVL